MADGDEEDSDEGAEDGSQETAEALYPLAGATDFRQRAAALYADYESRQRRRFRWLSPHLFGDALAADLEDDAQALLNILIDAGEWDADKDAKLNALHEFLTTTYPEDKVLVFSQFADTVTYLERELHRRGVEKFAGVTGDSDNPTEVAWRFSPMSNGKRAYVAAKDELRVLIATDVLSEGQNFRTARSS